MSFCLLDEKIIFIHIPKNAGSSIEECFKQTKNKTHGPFFGGHRTYEQYNKSLSVINKDIKDFFVFSVVRNPYSRAISAFCQMCKIPSVENFKRWAKNIPEKNFDNNEHWTPQYIYLNKDINLILRFEDMAKIKSFVKDKTGLDIPHIRRNKEINIKSLYNNETLEIIKEKYKKDFLYFGYNTDYEN